MAYVSQYAELVKLPEAWRGNEPALVFGQILNKNE